MLKGILLPSNMAAKTAFCLYLVKRLIVTLRCALNLTNYLFNIFIEKTQKGVIHDLKITVWSRDQLRTYLF